MNAIPSCSAIDTGLLITPNGGVKVCCSGQFDIGSIRTTSLNDIINSDKFIQIKNDLDNNRSTEYCQQCSYQEEIAPGSSQLSSFNKTFPSTGTRLLKQVDIRWSNVCNLTCRYCNEEASSEWARLKSIPVESVNRDYTESILDDIKRNKDTIESVYLLGGEPLLQKHNETLLDLIDPNTKIDIVTNLCVNLNNNRIYQKLKNFPNVSWSVSFENVGDRFEYVRHGSSWQLLLNNLDLVKQDFGPGHITLQPIYTVWSAFALKEFYDFAASIDVMINWQLANEYAGRPLSEMEGYTVFNHSAKVKAAAIAHIDAVGEFESEGSTEFFKNVRQSLETTATIPGFSEQFIIWTNRMEQQLPPKQSFASLWPELFGIISQSH